MSRSFVPDQILVDRLLQSDTEAFEELYRRYWQSLFSYCFKKLHSSDDARKIVRGIFISLWEGRETIPSSFSVSHHLYTEVRTAVVKQLNDKLALLNEEEFSAQDIIAEFSPQALQQAKQPSITKYQLPKASELQRQQTLLPKTQQEQGLYVHVKWLIQAMTSKIYS